jgi:hypothetical protein
MAGPMAIAGIGASVAQGFLGAKAAGNKAQGDQLAIQGQMLAATGKAFQYDVESQQFMWKSNIEKYQAAVAKINKQIAEENAIYARDKGEVEAGIKGLEYRKAYGQLVASQGASGVSVSGGSAARVREGMIEVGYFDQQMIRNNAARIAYGHEVQAVQYDAQAEVHSMTADLDKAQADNATTAAGIVRSSMPLYAQASSLAAEAGSINTMSSIVSAAGSVANKWGGASFQGMLPSFAQG